MERLQGPINPCLLGGEHLHVECFEQETSKTLGLNSHTQFVITDRGLSFEKEGEEEIRRSRLTTSSWSLEDKMPFLDMLQSADSPLCELSFQPLLSLQQHKKPRDQSHSDINYTTEVMECSGQDYHQNPQYSSTSYAAAAAAADGAIPPECNQDQPKPLERQFCEGEGNKASGEIGPAGTKRREFRYLTSPAAAVNRREKRKRTKRTRPAKKKEEVESQRMTHIAVERNRRRQMNDHLSALRSLMPSSYIQRGDQASIIGGAIDFVKELEQLLQSLQAQKRMRKSESSVVLDQGGSGNTTSSTSTSSSSATVSLNGMCEYENKATVSVNGMCEYENKSEGGGDCTSEGIKRRRRRRRSDDDELKAQKRSRRTVDVKVMTVIQNHVNLKVECPIRKPGQLLKAIVALEDLRLTVLHLNITSLETSVVHYSFNLKIEDDCELGSADRIAGAVHQIFSFIINTTHTI